MNHYQGYQLEVYGAMINDRTRMKAYKRALHQAIHPGCIVVDIGCGPGIFAFLACQFGAGRVYAIEPHDSIYLAHKLAKSNGYDEKIIFIQDISSKVNLPEKVDVIISDLRGSLPLFEHHIPTIIDARNRFLAEGGFLIPQADRLWTAIANYPKIYRRIASPWLQNPFNLDLHEGFSKVINRIQQGDVGKKQLLSKPSDWAYLDYTTIEDPDVHASLELEIVRPGTGHGLLLWFDGLLSESAGFSNAPGKRGLVYGRSFLPWIQPVQLETGDLVQVELHANLVGMEYIWRWETRVFSVEKSQEIKAQFKQSTLETKFFSLEQLRRQSSSYVPKLEQEGQLDFFVLSRMDGKASLGKISEELLERFPGSFSSQKDALSYVARLSSNYSA